MCCAQAKSPKHSQVYIFKGSKNCIALVIEEQESGMGASSAPNRLRKEGFVVVVALQEYSEKEWEWKRYVVALHNYFELGFYAAVQKSR